MASSNNCPQCGTKLTVLLYSVVCDICNPPSHGTPSFAIKEEKWNYGYITASRGCQKDDLTGCWSFVFSTIEDLIRSRPNANRFDIWKVKTTTKLDSERFYIVNKMGNMSVPGVSPDRGIVLVDIVKV